MAIYGLNFNRTEIPDNYRKRFAERKRVQPDCACVLGAYRCNRGNDGKAVMMRLAGVATDEQSAKAMCIQADNGHRRIHVERHKTAGADCFGIYVY